MIGCHDHLLHGTAARPCLVSLEQSLQNLGPAWTAIHQPSSHPAGGKNGQRCFVSTAVFSPDKLKDSPDFPVLHPIPTLASLLCSSHPRAEGHWVRSICGKTIPTMKTGRLACLCCVATAEDLLLPSGQCILGVCRHTQQEHQDLKNNGWMEEIPNLQPGYCKHLIETSRFFSWKLAQL